MRISQLIDELQKLAAEHGDLDMLFENNGCLTDVESVSYMQKYSLPAVYVIADRAFANMPRNSERDA
jgi:hypothetical protein